MEEWSLLNKFIAQLEGESLHNRMHLGKLSQSQLNCRIALRQEKNISFRKQLFHQEVEPLNVFQTG